MTRCRSDLLLKLKAGLTALKTMRYLIKVLTQTIKAWLTNDQFEIPNETTNPFHDRVLNAFQTQAGIGYDNLMRGLLAKEWRTLMDEWYRHTNAGVKYNGIRW